MSAKKVTDESGAMVKQFVFTNKRGLHMRPAAEFVKVASRFACNIFVEKDGERVNGKSIMGVIMLAAGEGSKLKVFAEGHDAAQALAELEVLFQSNRTFNEE